MFSLFAATWVIAAVIPLEPMANRINLIVACLAGCVISVLLAVLLMLKFDSTLLAFLPTICLPSLACWLGGLKRQNVLLMIAVFAAIGWFAGTAFTPAVAMSPRSQIERNVNRPLAGHDPILPCAICGAVFALGLACFASPSNSSAIDDGESL